MTPPIEHAIAPERRIRPRASGRITLREVAQVAGVSPITVSRALRNARSVDSALVVRVQAAANQLGYVPDPAARALASQRSTHVAMLVPLLTNALFVDILEAAQSTLRASGFQTLIAITHYDPAEEEQLLREQLLLRPAGLILTGLDQGPGAARLIAQARAPCVHLMDLPPAGSPHHCVGFSQRAAGMALTQHLLAQGRRRIAFAAAQLDPRTVQRLSGWRAALQEAGLHDAGLEWLNDTPSSVALGARMFEDILRATPPVDAIFFCNDDLAHGALLAAHRLQVCVPQQVAITGFNDLAGSDQTWPALTTVRTPRIRIGQEAARMLVQLMRGTPPPEPVLDLGFELVVRGSS